ncbi:snaclec coagulation factor IX/factor X-binding protein subunit B-like isoform X1 [Vanacampus margaritifer]
MAFALRSLFLFCRISGLLTGVWSRTNNREKDTGCPEGWTQLGSRCFVFLDERREFADAESVCNVLGGNLVSVQSALENAVLFELAREGADTTDDVWLGLHEAIEPGTLFWTDGSIVDFTAFSTLDDPGVCVEFESEDGLWDNEPCALDQRFICATDADHECDH